MAKTNFNNGSYLTPTFMDSFHGTNAATGHNHQELDADGSCPQIALSDSVSDYLSGTFGIDVTSTYFTTPLSNGTAWYIKIGNIVFVTFPDIFGHHAATPQLQLTPNGGNWPSAIIPSTAQLVGSIGAPEAAAIEPRQIYLNIPAATSSNIICAIADNTGILGASNWGSGAASPKGIYRRTLSWWTD